MLASGLGELVTTTLGADMGRTVTVFVPTRPPEAIVFTGDGEVLAPWGEDLARAAGVPATMVVGIHRAADETRRLQEYSPRFAPDRFAAHEDFLLRDVRRWVTVRFAVSLPAARTAMFGVSASAELALALSPDPPTVISGTLADVVAR